jgi:hypothetical protein
VNLLETVSLDLYNVLTLPVLTIFAEQYNIDIQEATQPKIKFMLSQVMRVIKTYPDRTSWNLASLAKLQQLTKRQRKRWQWIDQIDSVVSLQKLQTDAQV